MRNSWHLGLLLGLLVGETIAYPNCTFADIVSDPTLGSESSIVTPTVVNGFPTELINGGAVRGANLFHSFRQFNIGAGQSAYFANPDGVNYIIQPRDRRQPLRDFRHDGSFRKCRSIFN